eukprot:SAG11_NODE_6983_length_1214_cov_1.542601_2_plen_143_part_00
MFSWLLSSPELSVAYVGTLAALAACTAATYCTLVCCAIPIAGLQRQGADRAVVGGTGSAADRQQPTPPLPSSAIGRSSPDTIRASKQRNLRYVDVEAHVERRRAPAEGEQAGRTGRAAGEPPPILVDRATGWLLNVHGCDAI